MPPKYCFHVQIYNTVNNPRTPTFAPSGNAFTENRSARTEHLHKYTIILLLCSAQKPLPHRVNALPTKSQSSVPQSEHSFHVRSQHSLISTLTSQPQSLSLTPRTLTCVLEYSPSIPHLPLLYPLSSTLPPFAPPFFPPTNTKIQIPNPVPNPPLPPHHTPPQKPPLPIFPSRHSTRPIAEFSAHLPTSSEDVESFTRAQQRC